MACSNQKPKPPCETDGTAPRVLTSLGKRYNSPVNTVLAHRLLCLLSRMSWVRVPPGAPKSPINTGVLKLFTHLRATRVSPILSPARSAGTCDLLCHDRHEHKY